MYKTVSGIAIDTLFLNAMDDWHKSKMQIIGKRVFGLKKEHCKYWTLGVNGRKDIGE
ncbi:MAG: hypothetical protein ACI4EJ_07735 [Bacteroides sp.]